MGAFFFFSRNYTFTRAVQTYSLFCTYGCSLAFAQENPRALEASPPPTASANPSHVRFVDESPPHTSTTNPQPPIEFHALLAATAQQMENAGDTHTPASGKGLFTFQPEVSYTPTEQDEFFAKFGFSAGNGLNPIAPFTLTTWAADGEDDVKDINGRNRDYLLTAWYRHLFELPHDQTLNLSLGIIDATDTIDENAYANDEFTQFMNEALVNAPNAFLPSYNVGAAAEWEKNRLSLRGVLMDVGENDNGQGYLFGAAQAGLRHDSDLGEGNLRIILGGTSADFEAPDGGQGERKKLAMISADQALGKQLGAFVRIGWQDDEAAIDYQSLASGGLTLAGNSWGRCKDTVGLGLAYLEGGNCGCENSWVSEWYYRAQLGEFFAMTADLQYIQDELEDEPGHEHVILGLRAVVEF
ncbi:MAG: carbohydrate porin [Verrucomicrobiota bacterium]|nr:carbohydrate porin [Verrucomicrobiota bacterium]